MICKGAQRLENHGRRFPVEKSREAGIGVHFHERSEVCLFSLRVKDAVVWFYHKSRLTRIKWRPPLAADRYLIAYASYAACTEILRLRLRMTMRAGREARNVGSFLRKKLGEALRNTERFWGDCLAPPSR